MSLKISSYRSVVFKVGSAATRGSGGRVSGVREHSVEYRGSLKKKIENNRILFGNIEKGPIVEIA